MIICIIGSTTGYPFAVNSVMLSPVGIIISFAVSLRTTSVLEQFNEGRRAWSSISLASRNLAFLIWLHTPPTTLSADELAALAPMSKEREDEEKMKAIIEKRTMINLIQAFAVASKHYLRHEPGVFYEDLYYLVAPLPKYSFPSTNRDDDRASILGLWRQPNEEGLTPLPYHPADDAAHAHLASSVASRGSGAASPRPGHAALDMSQSTDASEGEKSAAGGPGGPGTYPLRPAFNPPKKTIYHAFPPLLVFRPLVRLFAWDEDKRLRAQKGKRMRRKYVGANVPLEISMFLSTWVSKVIRRKTLDPPFVTSELPVVACQA